MKNVIDNIIAKLNGIWEKVTHNRFVRRSVIVSKKLKLPGFQGVPLYNVVVIFYHGIMKGDITTRAAALSFNSFLAIFPAIIFFFTLIPYIPIYNFQDSLLALLQDLLPRQTFEAVRGTLFDIIMRPRGGLLSVGFLLAMYFATNSVNSMIDAFNKTYYTIETRSAVKQRMVSILLVFIISVLVILAIALITFGPVVLKWVQDIGLLTDWLTIYLISVVKWVVTFGLLFFAFSFLYYFAPTGKHRYKFITAGSTLATILFVATSIGFNFYVNNFSSYNSLYGSIGTLIVFMLWIYFNAIIILIGWELNSSILAAHRSIKHR